MSGESLWLPRFRARLLGVVPISDRGEGTCFSAAIPQAPVGSIGSWRSPNMPGRRKILTILISAAFAWPLMAQSERAVVQLKYLGTAGWEITDAPSSWLIHICRGFAG